MASAVACAGVAEAEGITTGPIRNVDLQVLVDLADPGDTLLLEGGIYDFYTQTAPVRITKRLRILAADPSDPPILVGNGDLVDPPPLDRGNNGFLVFAQPSDLVGLEFRGLHFRNFHRAIQFQPALPADMPTACAAAAPGVLRGATVRNCHFEDSGRGVVTWGGQIENLTISDNTFDHVGRAIFVHGGPVSCSEEPGIFFTGRSRLTRVARNSIRNTIDGWVCLIEVYGAVKMAIEHNLVEGGYCGLAFGDDLASNLPDDGPIELGRVIGNELRGQVRCGIWGYGPTTLKSALIANNLVSGTRDAGICLDSGANNMQVSNNRISGVVDRSVCGDINLGDDTTPKFGGPPATHDNVVITTDTDTIVVDGGIHNRILGTPARP